MTSLYLGVFGTALAGSFVLTRTVRDIAVSRNWVSVPANERHLHQSPLPRLGGVAIYVAFLLSIAIASLIKWHSPLLPNAGHTMRTILFPATLIFLLGLYDDVRSIGPYSKFAVQAIAASLLFAGGLRILNLPVLFGDHQFGWAVGLPLTILWVIGITNAFNLIDGLDGLAAGSGLFSTLVVFIVAIYSHSGMVSLLTIALAGAILGFLRFNFNPATIFLGDSGSLFIGFVLSALALQGAQKAPTVIAVAIPVVSFGLPIMETLLSVLRRLIAGRPVFTADREHIHHKLLERGLSHRQVVIVLYAVSGLFALLSLFLLWPSGSTLGLVLAVVGTGIWFGVQHLGYLEFGELARVAQRTMEQREIFINNLAVRRATQELKVAKGYSQLCRILEAAFSSNDFDAVELRLQLSPHEYASADVVLKGSSNDGVQFRWIKPGVARSSDKLSAWNLQLDLVTTGNRRRGSLSLYRLYSERALQMDINLLTSVFPVALADALDRAFCLAETPATAHAEHGVMAAEAGTL